MEAWDIRTINSLLETVIRGLPAGAALILNVNQPEPFVSRHLESAPQPKSAPNEHLLDGQQRLTALYRSLRGTYPDLDHFVSWDHDVDGDGVPDATVDSVHRWWRRGSRYPLWCDDPREVFSRGKVPLRLLSPNGEDINSWLIQAVGMDLETLMPWATRLTALREQIASYNIPFLSLAHDTPKDVALVESPIVV